LPRKSIAQAEFISAEHLNALGAPNGARSIWEAADNDVKAILESLEKECGAVLR